MLTTPNATAEHSRDRSRRQRERVSTITLIATLFALALTLMTAPTASADIFHLKTGGAIEGQNLGANDNQYSIRTTLGIVRLPTDAVERIEPGPTPFEEYDQRAAQVGDNAADQFALAEWCDAAGLHNERKLHLQKALKLDPDYEPARRALGYVHVAGLWLDGRTVVRATAPQPEAAESDVDAEQLAAAIQGQWRSRIRSIRQNLLESSVPQSVDRGIATIREITDPLAILPLAEVLSPGNQLCRELLVEVLSRFPHDEATLNLIIITLIDPLESIRQAALADLIRRDDPRIAAQYRAALAGGNDVVLRRAAYCLGEFDTVEAVPRTHRSPHCLAKPVGRGARKTLFAAIAVPFHRRYRSLSRHARRRSAAATDAPPTSRRLVRLE